MPNGNKGCENAMDKSCSNRAMAAGKEEDLPGCQDREEDLPGYQDKRKIYRVSRQRGRSCQRLTGETASRLCWYEMECTWSQRPQQSENNNMWKSWYGTRAVPTRSSQHAVVLVRNKVTRDGMHLVPAPTLAPSFQAHFPLVVAHRLLLSTLTAAIA